MSATTVSGCIDSSDKHSCGFRISCRHRVGVCWVLFTSLLMGGEVMSADLDAYRDAMRVGDAQQLAVLLKSRDTVLPRGSRGESLLHTATSYHFAENRAALIDVLLKAGLRVDDTDHRDLTPLHWAAGYGCVECIPRLLSAGADVNARRSDGGTPLHQSAESVIDLLLAAGADPRSRNKAGRLPLHTAGAKHAALLVEGVDARDHYGLTALHFAALQADAQWLRWLLDRGADPAVESTEPFVLNDDEPAGSWEDKHRFETGTRPFDMAKWSYENTRWSTGKYREVYEILDGVTPRRGWFSR